MTRLIDCEGLRKSYGRKDVLRDITLSVGEGKLIALLGHNGAGKTTLMKVILGLTQPSSGRVALFGEDPHGSGARDLRRRLGYLPENLAFPLGMSGRELLGFYAGLKDVDRTEIPALLESVGLTSAADQRVRTFSKGMRQRLGLAQALLGQPRLLFLDEPTNGLDPPLRRHFYDSVARLTAKGASALVSSHVLTEIEARADRAAILNAGRLVAYGSLDELRAASGLPLRLRLQVNPEARGAIVEAIGRNFVLSQAADGHLDFDCGTQDKMTVVRRVARLNGVVRDVDILVPRLDEVYAHFVGTEKAL